MTKEKICFYLLYAQSSRNSGNDLSAVVKFAKTSVLSKTITNEQPPPPREIILDIARTRLDSLFDENLKYVIGLVVDDDLCFNGQYVDAGALAILRRCFRRAKKHNPIIANHRFDLAVLSFNASDTEQIAMLATLESFWNADERSWVSSDVIVSVEEMNVFLKGQHKKAAVSEWLYRHEAFS